MVKRYISYLLRLWQVGSGRKATWRVSVEGISAPERKTFADLDALLRYLRQQTASTSTPQEANGESVPDHGAGASAVDEGR